MISAYPHKHTEKFPNINVPRMTIMCKSKEQGAVFLRHDNSVSFNAKMPYIDDPLSSINFCGGSGHKTNRIKSHGKSNFKFIANYRK